MDRVTQEADLKALVQDTNFWFGPEQFVVQMNMPDFGNVVYLSIANQDNPSDRNNSLVLDNLEGIRRAYDGFEPRVRKLLRLAEAKGSYIWKLGELPNLKQWASIGGTAVLVGDAAHAMLPASGMVSKNL
jgi:salicylate hydroxylase